MPTLGVQSWAQSLAPRPEQKRRGEDDASIADEEMYEEMVCWRDKEIEEKMACWRDERYLRENGVLVRDKRLGEDEADYARQP